VWEELVKDGRLGACIDIGMILSRILEEEGFWELAVSAPDNPFPKMDGWPVNGRIGMEFYKDIVKPHLEQLRGEART
jgi:hypothetical protein